MKKISKKMKQFLTFMLAVSMIVTAVPQTGMQVVAAGTDTVEAEETSITQETLEEDIVTEPSDGTEEESDSDDVAEEAPDNEDENVGGGGTTDDEDDVEEKTSDSDADFSNPDDEYSDEEIEDEQNPEDGEIPDDDADDSVTDETEEDETDFVEDVDIVMADEEIMLLSSEEDFTISSDGTLTKYTGTDTEIVIPDTVKKIGAEAFYNNKNIESVTFSKNVTERCCGQRFTDLCDGAGKI